MTVTLPADTAGRVFLLAERPPAVAGRGARFEGVRNGRAAFAVEAGTYRFTVRQLSAARWPATHGLRHRRLPHIRRAPSSERRRATMTCHSLYTPGDAADLSLPVLPDSGPEHRLEATRSPYGQIGGVHCLRAVCGRWSWLLWRYTAVAWRPNGRVTLPPEITRAVNGCSPHTRDDGRRAESDPTHGPKWGT